MEPFILQPLPESHAESSAAPTEPGAKHGEYGPRLVVQHASGFSCSTLTGYWRWCGKCGQWRKGVGVIGGMCCRTCNEMWD